MNKKLMHYSIDKNFALYYLYLTKLFYQFFSDCSKNVLDCQITVLIRPLFLQIVHFLPTGGRFLKPKGKIK